MTPGCRGRDTHVAFRFGGDVDPEAPAGYFRAGDRLAGLALDGSELRSLYERPSDDVGSHVSVAADGNHVRIVVRGNVARELDHVPPVEIPFDGYPARDPHSELLAVPADGGGPRDPPRGGLPQPRRRLPDPFELSTVRHESP
jgi:hypothetical protein